MLQMKTKEAMQHLAKELKAKTVSELAVKLSCEDIYISPSQVTSYLFKGSRVGVPTAKHIKDNFGIEITDTYGRSLDV